MRGRFIDLTGKQFGKWTVLERASNGRNRKARWLCRCSCGKEQIVEGDGLRNGKSKGCASCHVRNQNTTHGQTGTSLHNVWKDMIQRCEYSNHKAYKYYGGRGIAICPEWRKDFMVFRRWALENGYKEGLSLDRIDNKDGYKPENCQFLTRSENTWKGWHIDKAHEKKSG